MKTTVYSFKGGNVFPIFLSAVFFAITLGTASFSKRLETEFLSAPNICLMKSVNIIV